VRKFWDYAGFRVVTADSDSGPFNRAQARNRAVDKVTTPVVIVCDADSIPDLRSVLRAVERPLGLTLPFARYRQIPPEWADKPDLLAAPAIGEFANSTGGCWVIRTEDYHSAGGCDERFVGWGGEDVAFWYAAQTLVGAQRTDGLLLSFWQDTDRTPENNPLLGQYQAARGSAWKMREVLRRRAEDEAEELVPV
jgi:hypothetical protein